MATASDKIVRNTIFSVFRQSFRALAGFIIVPALIYYLTYEGYGVWTLLLGFVDLLLLFDIGIETSFVKFISESNANKDYDRTNHIINTGFGYYFVLGVVLLIPALYFRQDIIGWLKVPAIFYDEALLIYDVVIAILFLRLTTGVFSTVITGLQRIDLFATVNITATAIWLVGSVLVLALGWSFGGLLLVVVLQTLVIIVWIFIEAKRLFPQMRFNPFGFHRQTFREMFYYGINLQLSKGAELLKMQVDKILLSRLIVGSANAAAVASYELGARITTLFRILPEQLLPALTPASAEFAALNDNERLNQLLTRTTKYMALLVFPLLAMIFLTGDALLVLWLKTSPRNDALWATYLLSAGTAIFMLASVGRIVLRGTGIPSAEMRASIMCALLNVIFSYWLITAYGTIGAPTGTALALAISSLYLQRIILRTFNIPVLNYIKQLLVGPLIPAIIAGFAGYYCLKFAPHIIPLPDSRLHAFIWILFASLCFGSVYILLLFITRQFDKYDMVVLKKALAVFSRKTN